MPNPKITRRALLLGSGGLLAAVGIERILHFQAEKKHRSDASPRLEVGPFVVTPNWLASASDEQSGTLLLVGSDGAVAHTSGDCSTFERAETPVHQALFAVVLHQRSGNIVAAGADGCVVVSTDRARSFRRVPSGTSSNIRCLAQSRDEILAVGDHGLVLRSTDAGIRWSSEESTTAANLARLAALPNGGGWLAAGERGTLLRRTSASMWKPIELGIEQVITGLLVRSSGAAVVGSDSGAIYWSTDGWHFERAAGELGEESYPTCFAESRDGRILLASTRRGSVLRSADGGRTWSRHVLPTDEYLGAVAFDAASTRFLIVGNRGSLFRSDPQGIAFERLTVDTSEDLEQVTVSPKERCQLVAGRGGFTALSKNYGSDWRVLREGISKYLHAVHSESAGRMLTAVGSGGTCVRSSDGGSSWSRVALPATESSTLFAITEHVASHSLLIGGSGGLLLRSSDGAKSWSVIRGTEQTISAFHQIRGRILALALDEGVLYSDDAGQTFTQSSMPEKVSLLTACATQDPDRLVAVGMNGTICRSGDDGRSWERRPSGTSADLRVALQEPGSSRIWVAGANGTLLRSTNNGADFERVELPTTENLLALGYHRKAGCLVAVGNRGTILRSLDGGTHFELVPSGTDEKLRLILDNPSTGDLIVTGTGGVWLDYDGQANPRPRFTHTTAKMASAAYHAESAAWILVGERILRVPAAHVLTSHA